MKISVEGNQYSGEFIGVKTDSERWTGGEYYSALQKEYSYEGTCLIHDKKGIERVMAHFSTSKFSRWGDSDSSRTFNEYSLEQALLNYYGQIHWVANLGYEEIEVPEDTKPILVDMVLEPMFKQVKLHENSGEIPTVEAQVLDSRELLKAGLIAVRRLVAARY